jgi:ferrous iron transport protein A
MTLNDVKPGKTCRVVRLNDTGQTRRRIMDMGITRGAEITVKKVAPLNDPIEMLVRGYHLSLRRSDCRGIEVEAI